MECNLISRKWNTPCVSKKEPIVHLPANEILPVELRVEPSMLRSQEIYVTNVHNMKCYLYYSKKRGSTLSIGWLWFYLFFLFFLCGYNSFHIYFLLLHLCSQWLKCVCPSFNFVCQNIKNYSTIKHRIRDHNCENPRIRPPVPTLN